VNNLYGNTFSFYVVIVGVTEDRLQNGFKRWEINLNPRLLRDASAPTHTSCQDFQRTQLNYRWCICYKIHKMSWKASKITWQSQHLLYLIQVNRRGKGEEDSSVSLETKNQQLCILRRH